MNNTNYFYCQEQSFLKKLIFQLIGIDKMIKLCKTRTILFKIALTGGA